MNVQTFRSTRKFGPAIETWDRADGSDWSLVTRLDVDGNYSVHVIHRGGDMIPPGPNYTHTPCQEKLRLWTLVR